MSSTATISIFSILLLALFSTTPAIADAKPSVYEVLQEYDFPVGLLPQGVTNYELDRSTGEFAVYLDDSCTFTIEGYDLKYKSTITGTISKDELKNLSGVQVKILFFWLNIVEVSRDNDELEFSVGIVSADFAIDNFVESPQCGCGFDCDNKILAIKGGKANLRSLASSYLIG